MGLSQSSLSRSRWVGRIRRRDLNKSHPMNPGTSPNVAKHFWRPMTEVLVLQYMASGATVPIHNILDQINSRDTMIVSYQKHFN